MCVSFLLGFEGGMLDMIVEVPDQWFSFYLLHLLSFISYNPYYIDVLIILIVEKAIILGINSLIVSIMFIFVLCF